MNKIDYGFAELWPETVERLQSPGLLMVATDPTGKPNTMAIGWAALGVVWSKPVLVALVRPSRYTYQLVESAHDFTVNVPPPGMDDVVMYCGTVSGRDVDKFAEKGLTCAPSKHVKSPVMDECILHYECRVVHYNDVVPDALSDEIHGLSYPQGDYHRVYFGEILAVYGLPNFRELMAKWSK